MFIHSCASSRNAHIRIIPSSSFVVHSAPECDRSADPRHHPRPRLRVEPSPTNIATVAHVATVPSHALASLAPRDANRHPGYESSMRRSIVSPAALTAPTPTTSSRSRGRGWRRRRRRRRRRARAQRGVHRREIKRGRLTWNALRVFETRTRRRSRTWRNVAGGIEYAIHVRRHRPGYAEDDVRRGPRDGESGRVAAGQTEREEAFLERRRRFVVREEPRAVKRRRGDVPDARQKRTRRAPRDDRDDSYPERERARTPTPWRRRCDESVAKRNEPDPPGTSRGEARTRRPRRANSRLRRFRLARSRRRPTRSRAPAVRNTAPRDTRRRWCFGNAGM